MDNFNEIQKVWETAGTGDLPPVKELISTIKRFRAQQVIKKVLLIIFTLLMGGVMLWVLFVYKSNLLSTRLGEACFFLAMFILIITNASALNRMTVLKDQSNETFINYLKQEQLKLVLFYKRTQVTGFGLSALGLGLYLFEIVYHSTVLLITGYTLVIVYILLCWILLRPLALRKKTKKLEEMISKMEKFSKQLSTN